MIQLNYKYTGLKPNGETNSIIFMDNYFIVECPGYKGGKSVNIEYGSVKKAGFRYISSKNGVDVESDECELYIKIFRTEVSLSGIKKEFALEAINLLSIGKSHTPITDTKEWRELERELAKERRKEERAERRAEIMGNVSASVKGFVNGIFDEDETDNSDDDDEEEAKQKEYEMRMFNRLESLAVAYEDSDDVIIEKLNKMIKLIQQMFYSNESDNNENVIDYSLSQLSDAINCAEERIPNSVYVLNAKTKYEKFRERLEKMKADSKSAAKIGCGLAITFVLFVIAWAACEHFHWLGF